jgi:hypothetical protein
MPELLLGGTPPAGRAAWASTGYPAGGHAERPRWRPRAAVAEFHDRLAEVQHVAHDAPAKRRVSYTFGCGIPVTLDSAYPVSGSRPSSPT